MIVNTKQCDITRSLYHVEHYAIFVVRVPPGELPAIAGVDEMNVIHQRGLDLAPRALNRLLHFVRRGCSPPKTSGGALPL